MYNIKREHFISDKIALSHEYHAHLSNRDVKGHKMCNLMMGLLVAGVTILGSVVIYLHSPIFALILVVLTYFSLNYLIAKDDKYLHCKEISHHFF